MRRDAGSSVGPSPSPPDALAGPQVFTVAALTRRVARQLASDPVLQDPAVRGEISNFVHHTSGHMYFSLKDADSQLRCVMFRRENAALRFKPTNGTEVVAYGYLGVYEVRGEYQLYVRRMEPGGVGALYQAFEELKQRLNAEGLFAAERKRPLPPTPQRVAVATSRTGAAVRDILNIARRRSPGTEVVLIPTVVQGAEAAPSIARSLRLANCADDLDVLIVGRGGGSLEDLWGFNEETVARAAAESGVPVVSAVGHETDFTILDFVADVRAPTPSAAAELVFPDQEERRRRWQRLREQLRHATAGHVERRRVTLQSLLQRTPFTQPYRLLDVRRQATDDLRDRATMAMANALQSHRQHVDGLTGRLAALSPYGILERGYSVFRDPATGHVIANVDQARPGDQGEVILLDGTIECQITSTTRRPTRPPETPRPSTRT